jgi:HEAT repeat protein
VAQALVTIGSDAARAALRAAYPEAQGPCRIAIIQALGVLRDSESADRLAEDANGPDRGIQLVALAALATMESPAFREAARKFESQTQYERSQLDALLFRTSAHAAEQGEPEADAALTAELQSADPHIRSAALSSAAGVKSIDLVLSFLADEDAEVRATATNIAISLQGEGVTAAYLERLPKATETGRVALIGILGKRGDAAALSAVFEALQDESPAVRLAAVDAAAALGRTAAVEPLIKLLSSDDGDLSAAAQQALTNIRDEQAAAQIAGALSVSPARVQARLLQILADSHAVEQAEAICGCLEKDDEGVRLAALRAVEALAPSSALDPLVRLLPKLENSEQREACESALTAVCRRTADRVAVSGKLLAALPAARAEDYCSLLRVLGKLGGAEAFQTVRQALSDSRSEVVEAAFRALSTWPDPAAAGNILEVATGSGELRHHVLALRAYVRLVGADQELSAADKLAAYEKCMAHTRRVDERRLLLSKIGELPEPRTISVLQRFLLDDQLRNEAGAALLGVAERQLPAGWLRARQAIWLALDAVDDDALRERGKALLARAEEYEGFITDWQVAGPFDQDGKGCLELLEVAFPPEQPDIGGVTWRGRPCPLTGRSSGMWT